MIVNTTVPISMVRDAMKLQQDMHVYRTVLFQAVSLAVHSFDHSALGHLQADRSPVVSLFHRHMSEYTAS